MAAQRAAEQAAAASQDQACREMEAMVEAERAANEARLLVEAAARTAGEEVKYRAAEAEEECKRTAAVQEQAERDAQAAQEQSKKLQEAADKEKRRAIAAQEAANASKKVAEEQVKAANAAKEEAERKLKEGIQPVVTPTPEEVSAAKQKVQYREDLFHFAVAGVAGGGKSSLINAFRGLLNKDMGAAATGVTETTLTMARLPDPNAANMPDQRVYIVSNTTIFGVVKGKRPKKIIDEIDLLSDLIREAQTRRGHHFFLQALADTSPFSTRSYRTFFPLG